MNNLEERKNNFIKKSIEKHGPIYDYSKVEYVNINTKVCIIDPEYGEFWQIPKAHMGGNGNKKRKLKERNIRMRSSTMEFIKKANKVHKNFYDYSKVEYIDCFSPVCIIDPEYGEFYQKPLDHLQGYGNKERSLASRSSKRSLGKEEFIRRSKEIFGEDTFDYSKVEYINSSTEVILIDNIHGEFNITPRSHLYKKKGYPKKRVFRTNYSISSDRIERDHIIPLSIICRNNIGADPLVRNRPLFKFLNSDINIQYISRSDNMSKNDIIFFGGKNIRARSIRNDYNIILKIIKDELGVDASTIIEEDKLYRIEHNL